MAVLYRRIFFWIFVILFLVTTPLAVLYSQGYRFDQYKKIFVHSGSITVKSTPSSVSIYLNGELRPSGALDIINNSITVNGLRPGKYNLRVSADGYESWEKSVDVHSGVSTEFWNVYLVPKNIVTNEIAADGALKYFPSPFGKNIAFLKKNEESLEIFSIDPKNNEPLLIFSNSGMDFPNDAFEKIEWNSKETLLIVPVVRDGQKDFLILDSEKNREPLLMKEVTGLAEIGRVRWSPSNQNEIYFTAEGESDQENLYRMDVELKNPDLLLENVRAFDLSDSSIYFLHTNNIVYKSRLDGEDEKQLVLTPIIFPNPDSRIRLIAYDDDRQAVISDSGELYVHNRGEKEETLRKISENAKSVQFSNDGKKLLFWNGNEIYVLFLREWNVQPRRAENEIQQVIRFSSPIENIFWYRDYEHIFLSTQNSVKIIELDPRDHRIIFDVFKYNSDEFFGSYDASNGIYYYSDRFGEVNKIFYFNIPEQIGFFGGQ